MPDEGLEMLVFELEADVLRACCNITEKIQKQARPSRHNQTYLHGHLCYNVPRILQKSRLYFYHEACYNDYAYGTS